MDYFFSQSKSSFTNFFVKKYATISITEQRGPKNAKPIEKGFEVPTVIFGNENIDPITIAPTA